MRIAFTTKGKEWSSEMDARFGRTEFFIVYDEDKDQIEILDNSDSTKDAHGAGPKTAQKLFELKADVLITGNGPGGNAATVLEKTGMQIYVGAGEMTVKEAYEAYKDGKLKKF
ncbi:MAG: dinitrogenase iron-molybdenum cofactor biosynthesis protein [Chlorobi bacterium]|nr:dinitrogenase iron-molybdenum cofactor biosynthesis protein [Chlorobiota bacterium]